MDRACGVPRPRLGWELGQPLPESSWAPHRREGITYGRDDQHGSPWRAPCPLTIGAAWGMAVRTRGHTG